MTISLPQPEHAASLHAGNPQQSVLALLHGDLGWNQEMKSLPVIREKEAPLAAK